MTTPTIVYGQTPGTVRWWAAAVRAEKVIVDTSEPIRRPRADLHRYAIVGPQGVQQLSIPLAADSITPDATLEHIGLSEHGRWRHVHWGALYSAYGRTPFFEHLAPQLQPVILGRQTTLLQLMRQLHELVIDFMALPIAIEYRPADTGTEATDLRPHLSHHRGDTLDVTDRPYYQIWQQRHGFQPRMSILDLACHQGPEGLITLLGMAGFAQHGKRY